MSSELLFVSPVVPRPGGDGRSMRAWHTLHALAADHRVHLLIAGADSLRQTLAAEDLPVASRLMLPRTIMESSRTLLGRSLRRGAPWLASLACDPPEWARCNPAARHAIARFVAGKPLVVQHVFRLYMMPIAAVVRAVIPEIRTQLDLDDVESEARGSIASLYARRGERAEARLARRDARFYARAEVTFVPSVDRVWVCSERDRERVGERFAATPAAVVPNAAPVEARPSAPPGTDPFTFLFVGSLAYFPNRAGVEWLLAEVLPLLRRIASRPFRVRVVGRQSRSRPLRFDRRSREVELFGCAERLGPHYAAADAVVVPIHAGGGTRVKAIEAFGYQRPVVATPVGVEGLDIRDGVHALVAGDAAAFAHACCRLMEEPERAALLIARAAELYDARYSPEAVTRCVRRTMAPRHGGQPA